MKQYRKKNNILTCALSLIGGIIAICACTSDIDQVQYSLNFAGDNRNELEKVLTHYRNEPEKKAAAEFLIANMPQHFAYYGTELDSIEAILRPLMAYDGMTTIGTENKEKWSKFSYQSLPIKFDCHIISSEYLINHIDKAYLQYKKREWNKNLPFEDFLELILPYRVGDERITSWIDKYGEIFSSRLDSLYSGNDVFEACRIVMSMVDDHMPKIYNDELTTPHRDALSLLNCGVGSCRDDCDRYIFAMRACGIPVSSDMILCSPDNGTSHQWMVIRDNQTGKFFPFGYDGMSLTRDSIVWDRRTKGKVVRFGYGVNQKQLHRKKQLEGSAIPAEFNKFLHPRLTDVTQDYYGDNEISIQSTVKDEIVFLAICPKGKFLPIDCSKANGTGRVVFQNIEPFVIYFPMTYKNEFTPCGNAFYVTREGLLNEVLPDTTKTQNMLLERKMPLTWRHKEWLSEYMKGVVITASNDVTFKHQDTLLHIKAPLQNNYLCNLNSSPKHKYRFLKITPPSARAHVLIAELWMYSDKEQTQLIDYSVLTDLPQRYSGKYLHDQDLLTSFTTPPNFGPITLATDKLEEIHSLVLIPRNDDNFVWPNQNYELYYYDGERGWISVGTKTASQHSLRFEAPTNAVYLLRNHSKGKEEQVFIYQNDMQFFSLDLH